MIKECYEKGMIDANPLPFMPRTTYEESMSCFNEEIAYLNKLYIKTTIVGFYHFGTKTDNTYKDLLRALAKRHKLFSYFKEIDLELKETNRLINTLMSNAKKR